MSGAPPARRRIETATLLAVLAIAGLLRLWRLLQGTWLFFYNAFDPAGFVSIDKPPVAFWIQAAFAGAVGFDGWVLRLSQALG